MADSIQYTEGSLTFLQSYGLTPAGTVYYVDGSLYITEFGSEFEGGSPPVGRPLPQRVLTGPFSGPLNGPF